MASFQHLTEYLEQRGITEQLRTKYRLELIGGTEAAFRLGFKGFPDETVACWFPGAERYGHCVVISGGNFTPPTRKRYCTSGLHDVILLPGYDWNIPPERVVFTESYIKGIIAAEVLKLPTIVCNGVSGFADRKHSSRLAKSLRNLPWRNRGVRAYILFDSLHATREDSATAVRAARESLAAQLRIRYNAEPYVIELPSDPQGASWGVDDYVASGGKLEAIEPTPLDVDEIGAAVINFNERFAVVKDLARIVELAPPFRRMNQADFRLNYGNEKYADANGDRHTIVDVWLNASSRTTLDRVRFLPGKPTVVDNQLNMWAGFAVEPDFSGIDEAEEMWASVVKEAVPRGGEWLLDAWAKLMQSPDRRCGFYIYLYGDFGTGKGYTVSAIKGILGGDYGHAPTIRTMDYCGRFNAPKAIARVLVVDEVQEEMDSDAKSRMEAELKLDSDPAQSTRPLEFKGRDIIQVDRNALVIVLSNVYNPPWPIEAGDRRAAMLQYSQHMAIYHEENRPWGTKSVDWWRERFDWLNKKNGYAKVLAYLLEREVSKFDVEAPPPLTEYKRDVTLSKMGISGFIQQLRLEPKTILSYGGVDLGEYRYWNTELLLRLFHAGEEHYSPDRKEKERFGKLMSGAGFRGVRTTCRWYHTPNQVLWCLWGPDGTPSDEFKALVQKIAPVLSDTGATRGAKY